MAKTALFRWTILTTAAVALSACAVGPNYKRPAAPMQASYREAEGWTPATPLDHIDRGAWWSAFNDPALDEMERKVTLSNLNIAEAEAAYRQAKAVVAEDRAALLPAVSASLTSSTSGGGSAAAKAGGGGRYNAGVNADWAFDVFGKLRRQLEAGKADAQASAAALANARLAAQSALAIDYFTLRGLDAQANLLRTEVANLQRALDVAQNQYKAGVAARADVIAAETQLDSAKASLLDLGVQRGQLEHAMAVLMGEPPAEFRLPAGRLIKTVPNAPTGLPSDLLQRRPDVAEAERNVAAASAGIGVAEAAFFPSFNLTASDTSAATHIGDLFKSSTNSWALAATGTETIFNFGARLAGVQGAKAVYAQRVAAYRLAVLQALQNVEDELVSLRVLEQEQTVRDRAEASARQAETIALNQYKAGQVAYTSVIVAQNTAIAAETSAVNVLKSRLVASASLIEALGGGWSEQEIGLKK